MEQSSLAAHSLSDDDLSALRRAKHELESPALAMKLASIVGAVELERGADDQHALCARHEDEHDGREHLDEQQRERALAHLGERLTGTVLTVAAAEAAIGLAILVVFFRNRGTIEVEDVNVMKG